MGAQPALLRTCISENRLVKSRSPSLRFVSAIIGFAGASVVGCAVAASPPKVDPALHDQALGILQKSISYRTVVGAGQVPVYAEYL